MIIKDAPKLSRLNRFELDDATHGCYHCIRVFKGSEITEFVDNERTALCPHCGIDSVLPEVTNTNLLKICCEVWFTTVVPDEGELNTLQKLKILEAERNIYNIHYCKAGVGIVFYYPEKLDWGLDKTSWEDGLNCKQYYPTFEECIAAEYALLDIDESTDDEWRYKWEQLSAAWKEEIKTTTITSDLPMYEYEYVKADTAVTLGIEVNNRVDKGWEVDGNFSVSPCMEQSQVYVQRMRKEKEEKNA